MNLSSLYYGGGEEKFKLFLKRNEDRILSLLPLSISLSLSLFFLKGGDLENRRLYEDLGLVSGISVTERGKRILSAYPLFGSGEEKRGNYSSSFFPFLFSLISSGCISKRFERFITSPSYTSLFPWRKEEDLINSTTYTISTLIKLGIVRDNTSILRLDGPSSLKFMKMDEISRLSYILSPSVSSIDREKTKNFITLAFLINGVEKEDIEKKLNLIREITKTSISLSTLLTFGILNFNGETYTASLIEENDNEKGIVSPDLTISYRGKASIPLWRFALPLKADSLNQWSITKRSIKSALDGGMNKDEIILYLSSLSSTPLSPLIEERLSLWSEEYGRIKIERAVILETEERISRLIKMIPQMQEYIISNPSDNLFVMDGGKEDEWREILSSSGFDMLPVTKGPEYINSSASSFIYTLPSSPSLPLKREVEYDEVEYNKILSNSKSYIQKCLVSSHAVFSSKTEVKLDWVDGLDYREKRDKVQKAISEEDNLIIMGVDEVPIIIHPLILSEKEDGDELFTDKGSFDLSKIWMLSPVPSFVTSIPQHLSDSDNQ
ncbi:MAG: helicase-associated domain-containing protein [Candidatus Ornithospirochaeta sp.]